MQTLVILRVLLAIVIVAGLALLFGGVVAAAAIGAIGLGALIGVSEVIARYTDSPEKALGSWPGLLYVLVNMLAAGAAFGLAHGFDLLGLAATKSLAARLLTEALVAGLGAMAFFRSAIFTVRIGSTDVPVGPASVLQVILASVDRACDRERALPRPQFVSELMNGVSFSAAAEILPTFCFSAMQNVSLSDRQAVLDWVKMIRTETMEDDQKTLLLGLRLLNIVGAEVLTKTVTGLGPRIRSALDVKLPTLAMLQGLDFMRSAWSLVALCRALAQGTVAAAGQDLTDAVSAIEAQTFENEVKAMLLAVTLLKTFGDGVVARALGLVTATSRAAAKSVSSPPVQVPARTRLAARCQSPRWPQPLNLPQLTIRPTRPTTEQEVNHERSRNHRDPHPDREPSPLDRTGPAPARYRRPWAGLRPAQRHHG